MKKSFTKLQKWYKSNKIVISFMLFISVLTFNLGEVLYFEPYKEEAKALFYNNIGFALLSALFGILLIIIFLDHYYREKQKEASKQFLFNLNRKAYSDLILISNSIETFSEGNPKLLYQHSGYAYEYTSMLGQKFIEPDKIVRKIETLKKTIKELETNDLSQGKENDYYICFIHLMKNITLNLEHLSEQSIFIHPDDYKLKEIFQRLITIKQNLQIIENEIIEIVKIQKLEGVSEEIKNNTIVLKELTSTLSFVVLIFSNIKELLNLLEEISSLIAKYKIKLKLKS